jgi:hypothetical protein
MASFVVSRRERILAGGMRLFGEQGYCTVLHVGDPRTGDGLYGDLGITEEYFTRDLITELASGWDGPEIEAVTDGVSGRQFWQIVSNQAGLTNRLAACPWSGTRPRRPSRSSSNPCLLGRTGR